MSQEALIIFASSRSNGHTRKAVDALFENKIPLVDLGKLQLSYFDYESKNIEDDFIPLIEKIVNYQTLVFATPTYWYSMCAQMKTFFDRISDLYFHRKDLLDGLKGKNIFVVTSFGSSKETCFEEAFRRSSHYLQMKYHKCHYDYSGKNPKLKDESEQNRKNFRTLFEELHNKN